MALVAALLVAMPGHALAVPVQTIVDVAEITYKMGCAGNAAQIDCVHRIRAWKATIKPGTGQEDSLATSSGFVSAPPLDEATMVWMVDMHQTACGAPKAVNTFVRNVGALTKNDELQANIGTCHFVGGMYGGSIAPPVYNIVSTQLPQPTPRPTPRPTPTPTATPTPTPTPKATPKSTNATIPTPTAPPTAPPTAAPTASTEPAASPTAVASATPAATVVAAEPTPTPGGGGEATAAPTLVPTEPAGVGATPEPTQPAWEGSVLGIEGVNSDVGAVGGSLLLALLLLLLIGFIAELFNNTVENNYDEMAGWFRKGPIGRVRRALGGIRIDPPGRPGVLVFIALTALISSFVDQGFGLNVRSIAVFLGFLIGLIVVLASFKLPPILARRRRTGELGQLRPLPWALVIAAVFVLTSRVAHLQPGYLYGIVLGAIFVSDVSDRDEGRETFWGSIWTLAAAVLAWVALTWIRGLGLPPDGFGVTLLSTAFAATLVAGLEAAAFALMPLRFLPGYVIYKWNRPVWAVLWVGSLFAFIHILIGPTSGYVSELSPQSFMAALGVFAVFGAISIGLWLYFRFRNPPVPESAETG